MTSLPDPTTHLRNALLIFMQAHAPCLLLIDDCAADLRVLIDMLAARQWRTIVAFDGKDGYHKAILKQPDLILLDVRMPQMDGFATCRLLKANAHTKDIPVIFLTAADDKAERLSGFELGAVDYVVKPFASEEEVVARIALHLDLARRLVRQAEPPPEPQPEPPHQAPLLRVATRILLEDMAHPPPPDQLAQMLGTSEKRLNDSFHQAFGVPIFAWLREQRLLRARQLLEQGETSIADIAAHCGYTSPANFSTAFRERFGLTPRDFRKQAMGATSTATP
ncbi:MAG: DNA-binding response regulator [Azovibrio sp.]|nr:DNA-binding response regulator [Azovibrio sp.]